MSVSKANASRFSNAFRRSSKRDNVSEEILSCSSYLQVEESLSRIYVFFKHVGFEWPHFFVRRVSIIHPQFMDLDGKWQTLATATRCFLGSFMSPYWALRFCSWYRDSGNRGVERVRCTPSFVSKKCPTHGFPNLC